VIQCVALILRSTKFNPHFYKQIVWKISTNKSFGNTQTLLLRLVDREHEASDSARLYANVLGDGTPAYRDLGHNPMVNSMWQRNVKKKANYSKTSWNCWIACGLISFCKHNHAYSNHHQSLHKHNWLFFRLFFLWGFPDIFSAFA